MTRLGHRTAVFLSTFALPSTAFVFYQARGALTSAACDKDPQLISRKRRPFGGRPKITQYSELGLIMPTRDLLHT